MAQYEFRVFRYDEVGYYDGEDDQQQQQRQHKPRPSDWFKPFISVDYQFLSASSLRNLSQQVHRHLLPPTIRCQSFFGQEGEDYLRSHLSHLPFFTSERIHGMVPGIRYEVKRKFDVDMSNNADTESSNKKPPREVPLFLRFDFEVMLDDHLDVEELVMDEESARQVAMQRLLKKPNNAVKREQSCAICMEGFDVNGGDHGGVEDVLAMPCNHVFHRQCIVQWLKTSHVCPLCRSAMPTAND